MPSDLKYMIPTLIYQGQKLFNLSVNTFHGVEELNEPFRFTLELVSVTGSTGEVRLDQAVGQKVTLEFRDFQNDTVLRSIEALITEVTMLSDDWNAAIDRPNDKWRIVLRSPLWLLSLSRKFQVFKDMKASDIAQQLLSSQGLKTGSLEASTFVAKSTVQHGESDLEMFQRLLAEEGHLWVDRDGSLISASNHDALCPNDRWVRGSMNEDVTAFHVTRSATFSKSRVTAHPIRRFDQPFESEMAIKNKGISAGGTAIVHYPDHHGGNRDGEASQSARRTSTLIAERAVALAQQAHGTSELYHLGAGICLDLGGHRPEANGPWLISRIEHHFRVNEPDQPPRYSNEFTCVPFKGATMRPALREPPRVAGLRLGVIANNNLPDGDDELGSTSDSGLYAVRFPGEETSDEFVQCMRLAHPWAGPDRGFHFPLEVGDEVVVSHEHGDPGRPFILGCLHNAMHKGPNIATTDGKASSGVLRSRTGHELRYDEADGKGKITLMTATQDHKLVFDDGEKQTALTTQGKYVVSAKDNASLSTDANLSQSAKGDASLSAQGTGTVTSKGAMSMSSSGDAVTIESPSKITLKCGGSTIVLEPSQITIKSTQISISADAKASLEAAQVVVKGKATLDAGAPAVTIKGDAQIQVGAPNLALKGDAMATLDGAMVTVSASAMLGLKGAMINNN